MLQVRCTNCGSAAVIPDGTGDFCKCEACGSTFYVAKATAFSKVELDHTHDVRAWREYLAKQLRLQQESKKARDYGGVKLFAQKILSVLPDDFCAMYYVALADRYDDNDTAFTHFLSNADFTAVTPDELKEVVESLVATAEPKYVDEIKAFIARAYPDARGAYDSTIERNINIYIQKLKNADAFERDVFICHRTAAPDQDIADAICTRLEERGLRCWIAPRNILAGSQNYERDIIKGVESCRLFLFVSGFKSIYSEDCEKELKAAVLADKVLYSYRIDDTEYDGAFRRALSPVQWLDATDDPYAHLEQLVIDIKGMLAEDEREKAELEEKRLAARERERRQLEQQRERERERLERLERIVSGDVAATVVPAVNLRSRLKRAEIEVGSGNFERAENILDDVLDADPENPLAWWLLLLCEFRVESDEALGALDKDFTANANYKNALRFADDAVKARIEKAESAYKIRVIKAINDTLDDAEKYFAREDFPSLSATLDKCASAFSGGGMIFERFPDVASRYYWLRLWAKYGQTPLVCVEDITRESEYKKALRYASPMQAAEYERARITVSKNARLFLRERSKNRANDGKLVDYLIDNKNILHIDTYNYYSSLLYYRKMLSQLNMTEAQLRASTIDISTNEYFMLACSLATPEQKAAYDALSATLDLNRERKMRREREQREQRTAEQRHAEQKAAAVGTVRTIFTVLTAVVSIALFISAFVLFIDFIAEVNLSKPQHYLHIDDDLKESIESLATCFIVSSAFRIACSALAFGSRHSKTGTAFSAINLTLALITLPLLAATCSAGRMEGIVIGAFVVTIVSLVFSAVAIGKYKK